MSLRLTQGSVPIVGRTSHGRALSDRSLSTLRRTFQTLIRWVLRKRERRALRELAHDEHLLKDVGLTREQALREAGKLFWRP
jgi:uncharacterized protein YjiS (DUF1127 family)